MSAPRLGGTRPWSPEEDAALYEHYRKHGPSWPGWLAAGVDRTPGAISRRACLIGAAERRGGRWRPEEDEALRRLLGLLAERMARPPVTVAARIRELAARDAASRGDA